MLTGKSALLVAHADDDDDDDDDGYWLAAGSKIEGRRRGEDE